MDILAVGDCNTLGVGELVGNSYPERVAHMLHFSVQNCGYTMSTTREGVALLRDNLASPHDYVIIQFGLADSSSTFKYSPYILYYPDNFLRKQLRSIVKKYKKICRNRGLNKMLGEVHVVPEDEYRENLSCMIELCGKRTIFLPETIPHHEMKRNPAIQRYNEVLAGLAEENGDCHLIRLYDDFAANLDRYYVDETHANDDGYSHIAVKIAASIRRIKMFDE